MAYKNLVFKGGGVRGIAYLGALRAFYEAGGMKNVRRVAGTSAGAITAVLASIFPDDFHALEAAAESLDYSRIPSEKDEPLPEASGKPDAKSNDERGFAALGLVKSAQCLHRLVHEKGWYSSSYFYAWLKATIASRFTVPKRAYTFADFRDAGIHTGRQAFPDLYVTGTDISNRKPRLFSWETTPDMEVAEAVRISMSIPLFFESKEFAYPGTSSPQVFSDGGVMWNYPLGAFDEPAYQGKGAKGPNPDTLGFFLYTSNEDGYKPIRSLVDYIGALFESLLLVQDRLVLMDESQTSRSILIDDCGISQTQFDIAPKDADYERLVASGYAAAKAFLERSSGLGMVLESIRNRLAKWLVR
ncbi:MAG TPA: patatin-like phospholipase family protein [Rectinemataceae bacterium]